MIDLSSAPAQFTTASIATTVWATPRPGTDVHPGPADTATAWRCASLLKPLYAWVTPEADDTDVVAAIVESDNAATDRIVEASGGLTTMRERLNEATGVDVGHAETWGRFVLSSAHVALMYARFQASTDDRSKTVADLMRRTSVLQRFDTDRAWAYTSEQDQHSLAVKAGWDLSGDEPFARTHAVVLGHLTSIVVMSAVPVSDTQRKQWDTAHEYDHTEGVLRLHSQWAGNTMRAALHAASPVRVRRR